MYGVFLIKKSLVANAQSRALDYVKEKYAAGGHFWITSSHFDTWVEDTLKVYLGFYFF